MLLNKNNKISVKGIRPFMIHQTYSWKTKDKKTLFAQSWRPDEKASKTILLVHGLGEHSGRYAQWAESFVKNNYNFLSFDLRGHGKSSGKRGHAKSLKLILDDVDLLISKSKKLFPESKIILYGHSMGGSVVLNHIIERNYPIDALIVTSPWLRLQSEPSQATLAVSSIIHKIAPSLTIKSKIKPEQISKDPVAVEKYKNDPLNHRKISMRLFFEMYKGGYHASRNVYKINYPFLLMHGTSDQITSPKASENYVMNTSNRTTLKLWEDQYHELHHEVIKEEVFDYIIHWLRKVMGDQ